MFKTNYYLDFHTHRLRFSEENDVTEIVSLELTDEREHLQAFHHNTTQEYYTISKHPWVSKLQISEEQKKQIINHLQQPNCLALGEIGLDKLKGAPIPQQIELLKQLLHIAKEENVPVVLHCVRAFHQLLELKKEYLTIQKWCIHGYSRHWQLAKQLLEQGFYLSIMPRTHLNETYIELIQHLPANKFFLETDSMPNIHIKEIYLQVAEIRQISVEQLKEQMITNAIEFFTNE